MLTAVIAKYEHGVGYRMWPVRSRTETITCLACGCEVRRSDAREYDKYGDRWDREQKRFEHLCRTCHSDLCHHSRDDLEALLVELERETDTTTEFLACYSELVDRRYGPLSEESDRSRQ